MAHTHDYPSRRSLQNFEDSLWSPGFDNRVGERGKDGEDASSLLRDPFPVETLDSGGESIGEDSAHVLAIADSPAKSSTTRPNTRSTADTDAVSV